MTTVTCVGIAVMDLLFSVDALPTGPGKLYADGFVEVGGGVAANAAVAVARLGGTARYVGRVGDDALGIRLLDELRDEGVDVTGVTTAQDLTSPVSAVFVDGAGERTIVNHTPPDLFAGPADLAAAADGSDAVLVDVRWPSGAESALAVARAAGIPSVFDFDRPMDDEGDSLIELASHVAFSDTALAATAGTTDTETALRILADRTDAWLAVTRGARGVWWLADDELCHQPAFPVDAVDTVGAGDVFHGALALALAEGRSEAEAVRFASAAAALKCTRPGGRSGTPTRSEVDQFLEEQP